MIKFLGWVFLALIAIVAWKIFSFPSLTDATKAPSFAQRTEPARCTASDFTVENFKPSVYDDCRASSCPHLKFIGHLVNKCQMPAGAQLKITAYDKAGNLMDTVEGWPASTRNLAPGEKYPFDMSHMMTYRKGMHQYSIQVIDAKSWSR